MSRDTIRGILGDPELVSPDDYGDNDLTEAWYYQSRGFSLHFNSNSEWRLICIEVDAPSTQMAGRLIIGLSRTALVTLLTNQGLSWDEQEDGLITVDTWSMNFWLEDGVLTSVQLGVLFDDDDNEIWPTHAPV